MPYGSVGTILNSFRFSINSSNYNWGPFLSGDGEFPVLSGVYPVNQGVDPSGVWAFDSGWFSYQLGSSPSATSTHSISTRGIDWLYWNFVALINIEIYVRAQLFIVNTVTNTAGATLDIPITGITTVGGATITVPNATWAPLQATGQQHKIVMRVYIAHYKYKKGCLSGGNHTHRSNETTDIDANMVPISPGTYDWEKGWVNNVSIPVIATWSGTQVLQRTVTAAAYESSTISINATLEAILPDHPVYGTCTNSLITPIFTTLEALKVSVIWGP